MSESYELNGGLAAAKKRIEEMRKKVSPLVVGVAGGSGSGKTSKVAKSLCDCFPESVILSMDDYFKGQAFMESIGSENWDEPRALDLELLKKHLDLLKRGCPVQKPVYSFKTGEREGYEKFESADLIILEGLFALHDAVVDMVDLKIFVDVAVHGSLLRRLIRDVGRSGQSEKDIFKQYVETVYPMYGLHVEPTKSRADIIIVNQYAPEIEAELCGSQDIQIKAFLSKKIALSGPKGLLDLGFQFQDVVSQYDTYYSAPNWGKDYKDELMRIREEANRYFLAYKGPSCDDRFSVKQKIEFEVEPRLKDALEKLGYRKLISVEKYRIKFSRQDGLELVIDKIEGKGSFLEFRAKNSEGKAKIAGLLNKLGIDEKDVTNKSYLELMLESSK